jgi:MFS family permease
VRPAWSSRNVDLVLAARAAMSAGRSLAGVLVPIYLALQGFTGLELAAYVLVVAATSAILSLVIGTISDQVGRRPFLVVLPLVTAAAGLAFAFSRSDPLLFVMGALGSLGRGSGAGAGAVGPYQPAESAFVTEILPPRFRNAAFGRLSFSSSLGAMVGSLLALLVPSAHLHGAAATAIFRDGFLAVAVTSALAGLIALGLTEPGRRREAETGPRQPAAAPADLAPAADILAAEPESTAPIALAGRSAARLTWPRLPARSRWLLYRLWITNSLNGVAVGMFGPFVTYWFFRRFGASAAQVGVLFAVINAATMVSSLSAARLADRWGLVRTVTIMRTAQALLLVPMVLAPTFAIAGGVYFIRMVVQRIGLPLRQSYALGLADPGERGSVAALSNVPSQVAMAVSPLLTGYMMDEVSLALPFELAALFQFLNATSFWVLFHRYPPEEERERAQQGLRSAPRVALAPETTPPARDGQDPAEH